jgi:hypothetical protein
VDVYGHYAATRLLLEHDLRDTTPPGTGETRLGEHKSALAVATAIRCHAGLDLITGMPILIYLLPAPINPIHETYSEYLPALLETGTRGETTYVVMASAPGYVQLRPTLTETRLHWFARSSARAILDAHIAGVSHGALSPSHVFAQGDHLFVAGFGLPWADSESVYRAPEGEGEFPADIYAWARTVQHYGSGDPSNALPGDFGKLIGHCLHDDPRERPTAGELVMALEQVLSGASPWTPPARTGQTETVSETSKLEPSSVALLNPASAHSAPVNLQQDEEPLDVELEPDDASEITAHELTAHEPELISETHAQNFEPVAQVPEAESSVAHVEQIGNGPITRSLETITTKEIPPLKTPDIVPEQRQNLSKPALEIIEGDALPIDIDALEAPPHPLVEAAGLEADEPDVPIIVRGNQSEQIRIGFEGDPNNLNPNKPPVRFSWVGVLAGLIGVGALGWLLVALVGAVSSGLNTRPNTQPNAQPNTTNTSKPAMTTPAPQTNTPTPNTQSPNQNELLVNFKLEPENGKRGRLVVLEAPAGAALQSGDPLATVPGPVLFPVAGTYKLQVVLDGYNPAETTLKLPTSNRTVILRLQ